MLQKTIRKTTRAESAHITIVASAYNAEYVDSMIDSALAVLAEGGVKNVELIRVPGAFEIPLLAAKIARRKRKRPQVILNLGVIFRGKTAHAEHIGNSITLSLARIAIETEVPMIHEVLLLDNKTQAKSRCLSKETNRGAEAAHTALAMVQLLNQTT